MREALRNIRAWVASLTVTDMNEIVADNGITAGMVVSQEAGEQLRRIDAALSAPQPIGIRRRAQRIVEIANQYEGYDEIALVRVPVGVLRAAAMIVNGQALAPMLNTMTAPETSGQVAQEEITPEDQAAAASIGMPNTAKVFSHHRRRAVEGLVEKVAKMEARPDWSGLTRVQLGYESGFAHAINAVTALLHAGHSDA